VPLRHYLLPVAACGSFLHCHGGPGPSSPLGGNIRRAPPPPAARGRCRPVVTKSVRSGTNSPGDAAIGAVDSVRASAAISTASPSRRAPWSGGPPFCFLIDPRPYRSTYYTAVGPARRAANRRARGPVQGAEIAGSRPTLSRSTPTSRATPRLGHPSATLHAAERRGHR